MGRLVVDYEYLAIDSGGCFIICLRIVFVH